MTTDPGLCNPTGGRCNQPAGHAGDHGMAVAGMPGLVIAPWPNVGTTEAERLVEFNCDICAESMRMAKGADGGTLSCTSDTCGQTHTFRRDGAWSHVIVGKLFPNRYTSAHDMPADMRRDFIDYKLKMALFYTEAMWLLGLIDNAERQRQTDTAQGGVRDFWADVAKREEDKDV